MPTPPLAEAAAGPKRTRPSRPGAAGAGATPPMLLGVVACRSRSVVLVLGWEWGGQSQAPYGGPTAAYDPPKRRRVKQEHQRARSSKIDPRPTESIESGLSLHPSQADRSHPNTRKNPWGRRGKQQQLLPRMPRSFELLVEASPERAPTANGPGTSQLAPKPKSGQGGRSRSTKSNAR